MTFFLSFGLEKSKNALRAATVDFFHSRTKDNVFLLNMFYCGIPLAKLASGKLIEKPIASSMINFRHLTFYKKVSNSCC